MFLIIQLGLIGGMLFIAGTANVVAAKFLQRFGLSRQGSMPFSILIIAVSIVENQVVRNLAWIKDRT